MTSRDAWVIGGTTGIGHETCFHLKKTHDHIIATNPAQCDVTRWTSVENAAKQIIADHNIQSVVFCAGTNYVESIGLMDPLKTKRVVDVNLTGFMLVIDALKMHSENPLRVVVITSDAAVRPLRASMAYCASKAGLNMAVRVAAKELGPKGWKINGIAPGMVQGTGMTKYVDHTVQQVRGWTEADMLHYEQSQEVVKGRIPTGAVAMMIADMLDWPPHFNGEIVTINGGR